jgi:hypothetical protein
MRPLRPLDLPPFGDLVPALIDVHGRYCGICELPLLERAFAWDTTTGQTASAFAKWPPSSATLLLCRTCDDFQAQRQPALPRMQLPFSYDADGLRYEPHGEIRPLTEAAALTFDYFELGRTRGDPRWQGRARAWEWAQETPDERPARLARLIAATGFLSVWRQRFDVTALREAIPGFYPGTDWSRLDG